jgi:hypothetical protein
MTTAVANPSIPAQHAAPPSADGVGSSRTYATIAPSTSSPHAVTPNARASKLPHDNASPTSSSSDHAAAYRADGKRSPLSYVVQSLYSFLFLILVPPAQRRLSHLLHVSSPPRALL